MQQKKVIKPSRAIAIVVSNKIGTGVYTSLGLQAAGINSVSALLFIWITLPIVIFTGWMLHLSKTCAKKR